MGVDNVEVVGFNALLMTLPKSRGERHSARPARCC
jgi:hypothetical protein